eukprot:1613902-Alexandrium_andersonii.AAC.1
MRRPASAAARPCARARAARPPPAPPAPVGGAVNSIRKAGPRAGPVILHGACRAAGAGVDE